MISKFGCEHCSVRASRIDKSPSGIPSDAYKVYVMQMNMLRNFAIHLGVHWRIDWVELMDFKRCTITFNQNWKCLHEIRVIPSKWKWNWFQFRSILCENCTRSKPTLSKLSDWFVYMYYSNGVGVKNLFCCCSAKTRISVLNVFENHTFSPSSVHIYNFFMHASRLTSHFQRHRVHKMYIH